MPEELEEGVARMYTRPASLWRIVEMFVRVMIPAFFVMAVAILALRVSPVFAGVVGYIGFFGCLLERCTP